MKQTKIKIDPDRVTYSFKIQHYFKYIYMDNKDLN